MNTGKTKIMKFRKGRRKMGKRKWLWKGREVKEVKDFRYLGYTTKELRAGGLP